MVVRFAKSARRHRIGRAHVLHVMEHGEPIASVPGRDGEPRMIWVGPDDRGLGIEVTAVVVDPATLLVIHVMPTALRGGQ